MRSSLEKFEKIQKYEEEHMLFLHLPLYPFDFFEKKHKNDENSEDEKKKVIIIDLMEPACKIDL